MGVLIPPNRGYSLGVKVPDTSHKVASNLRCFSENIGPDGIETVWLVRHEQQVSKSLGFPSGFPSQVVNCQTAFANEKNGISLARISLQ